MHLEHNGEENSRKKKLTQINGSTILIEKILIPYTLYTNISIM